MRLWQSNTHWLVACLLLLVVWAVTLAGLSHWFEFDKEVLDKPVLTFVLLQMAAGVVYLLTVWLLRNRPLQVYWLTAVLLAGLLMRVSHFGSLPVLETDPYRYLWDGAVTAAGYNPYAISPHQVRYQPQTLPPPLQTLAHEAGVVIERINHPTLRTIYPPITQAALAIAHWIKPFSLDGLRCTWLMLDIGNLGLLLLLLHKLKPESMLVGIAIYWLNPLLIKEVFNSGHMELVLIATLLLVLLAAVYHRMALSMLMLSLAVLAKIWPILWLPLLLRMPVRSPWQRWLGITLFIASLSLLLWPVLVGRLDGDSGFVAYTQRWQMNDSVHQLLYQFFILWLPDQARLLARLVIIAILLFLLARCIIRFRHATASSWLLHSTLTITAGLFLLSPTQFPWYWLWLLPLLALRPMMSLLALTITLPIYYLYHPLHALGQTVWFDLVLVWVQFVPIWVWLFLEVRSMNRPTQTPAPLTSAPWQPPSGLKVAVIIPALNEASAIAQVIDAIPPWVTQIIVADNGSTDRTPQLAQQHGAMVVHQPHRGYGAACLAGIAALDRPDIVVFIDGDFSDHPQEMVHLVEPIARDEADMVIGSRVLGCAEAGALTPQQRFGNALACALIRLLYGVSHSDLGPFRAIRYASLQHLAMDDRDFGWTVQMQVRAARMGMRAVEVPVSYRRRIGKSKISGTIRGVFGAGTKIISTIFRESLRTKSTQPSATTDRLIIFARYPTPGQAKTRLIPLLGPTGAALLHRQLVRFTVETSRRLRSRRSVMTQLRYTGGTQSEMSAMFGDDLCYKEQAPGDLGNRLRVAAAEAIRGNAGKVVLIGTDCPLLDAERLNQAFAALDAHDVVIGPATDGGYYLIGVKSDHPELFTDIAWGGPEVLNQTLDACRRLGLRYALLPQLSDVDTPDDLATWAAARMTPPDKPPRISVIIPTRNEQDHLAATLASVFTTENIQPIVVDGQSTDRTREIAGRFGITVVESQPSRGRQLNLGAAHAHSDTLLFLHADTILPFGYAAVVQQTLRRQGVSAGAFELRIDAHGLAPRLIELGVHVRARIFGRPYGDQAFFMSRDTYTECGGFPDQPTMEDYAMLSRLKAHGRVHVARASVSTSARRWQTHGWLRTTLRHQWTIMQYHLGRLPGANVFAGDQ